MYFTDKEKFDKIPSEDKSKENNSKIGNKKKAYSPAKSIELQKKEK